MHEKGGWEGLTLCQSGWLEQGPLASGVWTIFLFFRNTLYLNKAPRYRPRRIKSKVPQLSGSVG